jgi:hypothetical protein
MMFLRNEAKLERSAGVCLLSVLCLIGVACGHGRAGVSVADRQRVAERFVEAALAQRPTAVVQRYAVEGVEAESVLSFVADTGVVMGTRPVFHRASCPAVGGRDCFEFIVKTPQGDKPDLSYTMVVSVSTQEPALVDAYDAAGGGGRDNQEGLEPIAWLILGRSTGSAGGIAAGTVFRLVSDPSYEWRSDDNFASVAGGRIAAQRTFHELAKNMAPKANLDAIVIGGRTVGSMVDLGGGMILKLLAPSAQTAPKGVSCPDSWALDFPSFLHDNLESERFRLYFCER